MNARSILVLTTLTAVLAAGCSANSMVLKRPADKRADDAVTRRWTANIRAHAQSGDWILSRSYSFIGDVITAVDDGDYSHASIYDADRGTIIEAIGEGTREVPLESLVRRNYHLLVVRPKNTTATERRAAVLRARAKVGTPYDVMGLMGVQDPDKFYCTELVLWSIEPEKHGIDVPLVIEPSDLLEYSRPLYYTGTRDSAVRAYGPAASAGM